MTEITVNLSTTPDMIFSCSFRSLAVCDILHEHFLINGTRCYPSSNGSRSHLAVAVRRHEGQSVFICLVSDVRVLWESRRADLFQLFLNAVKVRKHNLKFKFETMVGIVASKEEDKKNFFNKLFPLGDKLHKLAKTIIENRKIRFAVRTQTTHITLSHN